MIILIINEDDVPNFFGSSYSVVKGYTDRLMNLLNDSVLVLKIRMPISEDNNPRNFIYKITHYEKICSIPNSMTDLLSMIPIALDIISKKIVGSFNFTNPGTISHNEILEMYREIIDPTFTWKNFTIEEQDKILLAARSNNCLSTVKLETLYPNVLPIKEAIRKTLERMKFNNK